MPIRAIEFHKASTQEWVSASDRDPADEDGLRLLGAAKGGPLEIMYADIPGASWNQNRLNKFVERANQLLQYRIPLADIPDDENGLNGVDPGRPDFFWDGGDLVSQPVVVENATFIDGVLNFTVRRNR